MAILNNKKIRLQIFLLVCTCLGLSAQEYPASTIPDSLKKDAVAVVRNYTAHFEQSDKNSGIYKETSVITILNEKGDAYADFSFQGDKFRTLSSFSGIIRDVEGNIKKKIKKGDLLVSSINNDASVLISDNFSASYECKFGSYPYTVEYTFEEKWKNGILSYYPFMPIIGYEQALENASYTIEIPSSENLRYRSNFDCNIVEKEENGKKMYVMSAANMSAIPYEPSAPPANEVLPRLLAAPTDFCYDSFCGNMVDWKNYGMWIYNLTKDKNALPPDFAEKLSDMVKDAKDDKEKVRILYKFMVDNTRYVNVKLGIGGYRPIDATTVNRTKFGDCKGLSNYMKAMLDAVGIPSNYVVISAGNRNRALYKDFPNFQQLNHAILLVPLKNDSVWLECTSSTPFGYVHRSIAGQEALVITEQGGTVCRLPAYDDIQNLEMTKLTIDVKDDGSAAGEISIVNQASDYEACIGVLKSKDRDNYVKFLNQSVQFPRVQYDNITTSENDSDMPSATFAANFTAPDFVGKTASRYFLPVCPLKKSNFVAYSASIRKQDIYFSSGYTEVDSITFNIPASYVIESLPKNVEEKSSFGNFKASVIQDGNKIIYIQNIDMFSGRFEKEKYKEFKNFLVTITSAMNKKIVIKKVAI